MRALTATLVLTLTLCACGGTSPTVVPSAPAAAARIASPAASGMPWVFVTNESPNPHLGYSLYAFAPAAKYGRPIAITKGLINPTQIATDAAGNLFVLDDPAATSSLYPGQSAVLVYAPPYTGAPVRTPVKDAGGFALDRSGDLFISKASSVLELKPPYRAVYGKFAAPKSPGELSVDSHGNVFLGTAGGVNEYSPPSYRLQNTISIGKGCLPSVLSANSSGRLFVATLCRDRTTTVTAYKITPGKLQRVHMPIKTCSLGPAPAAMSLAGDFFLSNACGVLEISPLFVTVKTLNALGRSAGAIAVSGSGDLYSSAFGTQGSSINISVPPYGAVEQTFSVDRYNSIYAIALGP